MIRFSVFLSVLVLFSCKSKSNEPTDKLDKNISIFFHDQSLNKENPSIVVFINNQCIFQSDSIEKSKRQDFEIWLSKGKYHVRVQTKDSLFLTRDSIIIQQENKRHILSVKFKYNPPVEWYKDFLIRETYRFTLQKNNIKKDSIIPSLMDSLTKVIRKEYEIKKPNYSPSERYFTIDFMEQPNLE